MPGPVLFCYDGSAGSRHALQAAGDLIARPARALVLTVWQPAYVRLAAAGSFAPLPLENEPEVDEAEEGYARQVAEEGAGLANRHGYNAVPLTEQANQGVAQTILAVADRTDAALIVCGQRGRGAISTVLLGSVSHSLSAHTRRPILIAPEGP